MRIAIVGNSGSGKSTLAKRLAAAGNVAVLDLDTIAWEPGQVALPRDPADAAADVLEFCRSSQDWVVEGCYTSLIEVALELNPELVVLDPGVEQCTKNCRTRPWEPHKYSTKDEQDQRLEFLLEWLAAYYSRDDDMSLLAHKRVYEGYAGVKHWLSSPADYQPPVEETT